METQKKTNAREQSGIVVSDKMTKTRVVAVSRMKRHPKYLKYYKVTTKFKAHDETNASHVGDHVIIRESRPMSREKRWTIVERTPASGTETE